MLRQSSILIPRTSERKKGKRRREGSHFVLDVFAAMAPVVYTVSALQGADVEPSISPIGAQVFMTAGMMWVQLTRETLRITFTAADALSFLRRAGNGSLPKGVGSVSAVNMVSMVVPIGYAVAYSTVLEALHTNAEKNNNLQLMVLFNVLDNPLLQSALLGVPALAAYGLTKRLIYKSFKIRETFQPAKGDALSLWKRAGYAATFRILEGVGLGELMFEAFRTFGPALVVHSPFSTIIPVVLEQWVLKPVREYRTPTEGAEVVSCLTPKAAALYGGRSALVIGVTLGLSWLVLGWIDEDRDPESMNEPSNLFYEIALMAVALLVEQAINLTPPFRENTGTWYHKMGLFQSKDPDLRPLIEREYNDSAMYEGP